MAEHPDAPSYADLVQAEADVRAELDRLRAALVEIVETEGQVCGEYDRCSHPACASSYAAWAIADRALGPQSER